MPPIPDSPPRPGLARSLLLATIRLGARSARAAARAVERIADLTLDATAPKASGARPPAQMSSSVQERRRGDRSKPPRAPSAAPPPLSASPKLQPRPAHVDTEETLVAASADPAAADGARAELHVPPPWQGYDALRAREVIDRLVVEDEAALALLLVYEGRNRARSTVLRAGERELARRRTRL